MAKKHKKHYDEWDVDRESQLALIYDGYIPNGVTEEDDDDTIESSSIHTMDDDDPNYASEITNEILASIGDCCDSDPDIPEIESSEPIPVPSDLAEIVPTIPVYVPESWAESESNEPTLTPASSELSILRECAAVNECFDDDDEDDDEFTIPEVCLMYDEKANVVTFTDGFNTTSINLSTLVRNGRFGKPNPDNVARQIMAVMESCITTTLPLAVISEDEFNALKDITSRFDSDKYRFSNISIMTKKNAYAVYKLAPDFFQVLERITQYTSRNNITMMFLKVLLNYCYEPNHLYVMTIGSGDEWYSTVNDEIADICGEFDWQWDVFFETDGVDPFTTQGRGVMSREDLEAKFSAATTEPGRFTSPELTEQILSADEAVIMTTPKPTEISCGVDTDDVDFDDDDEEDDDSEDGDVMDIPEGIDINDLDDTDELADALAEGLSERLEENGIEGATVNVEVTKTESLSVNTTVTMDNTTKEEDNGLEADDFVFDVVRTKKDY